MIRQQFLDGAGVVVEALRSPVVGASWDAPSVLEHQTVGSLAGHLARGGIWVVADYLDQEAPLAPTYRSGADYYATLASTLDAEAHLAIRARGAEVACLGWAAVVDRAEASRAELVRRLNEESTDRLTAVAGGSMLLDDYLVTRIVEQVVHLHDLARSVGVDPWPIPDDVMHVALSTGVAIGARRFGSDAMIRAIWRDGGADVLPVL